ncbi:unnamed protein product [Tilletia laevis]|uniref:Uncharacterized protein n=1 Tax=Tilletia laevis TaxID=157183 RepID=A0A9N8M7K4_9BASI|nr:unnamed protein product [Tilletia laevis]
MAPANKRQRLTEHESTSTSTPAQSGLPDDSVEVPIIETNNRAGPSSSSSSAGLHQRRPRGRPPGTKNKPQEKPRGSLLRISTSAADEDGPQEIDEEDELVDEDMDDTVDMSVMQPTSSTTATTTTTAAATATTTAAAAAAAEATTAAKARQEEIEQEALIARVLQGGQGPIVNSSKVKTEAFLEIPATRSPRYPPVVQKVLTSATGDNGDDDDDDDVIEIQRPSALPLPDIVPSSKPVPSRRSLGKQRKIVEDEVMADSSDSRPSPAPTGGAGATPSKPTTRGRGAPASRVRAVTEAEFKGLLGPRTGSSLEPTPPPNSRALRSAQSRAGRGGSEGTSQVRERERDASSPVEEFLSQPQAIVSAEELARRAVPRVGGWIVPLAPPRAAPAAVPSGYTSRAAPGVLQIATSPHRRSSAHQVQQADKFAVVVPIRAGPPQGEFGREEQLADAYVQLRDRYADSATIRTPQDLANALQQSGVLQQQQQGEGQAGPSVAPGASTPVQGSSAVRPVVAAPCLMAPPVGATQTPNGSIAAVQAPVVPGSSSAATRRTSTGPPVKSGAVADLEQRMMRSPAIPSFLKREIIQLLRTLTLQPDPKVAGAYAVNIDLARIPLLATKDCWWFDLDLGKVQEGGNGYTVILNLELAEQTLTTHGMSRALVKQVHTIPSISPWYDSFGRRRMDDGTLMPDANRVEGGVQTESLEDAQSIAVVEYQAELVKLKRELERTKTELEAESVAKQESEEQSAFRQRQYDQASTRAVELSREVTTLETQVSTLKRQLSDGLAAHRLFSNAASERYQADLRELQMENRLLRAQARNTDNEVRRRAAEYDTLRAMEVVRLREKEKVFRAQGGVGPYVPPPPAAPVLSIAAAPRAAAAAPPTAAAAPSLALPLPLPPPSLQRELVRSPAGAISLARGASTPSGSKQAAHSPTPPSVAAGMAPPTNNGTLFLGPEMGSSSQLGGTQGSGMSMDISADDLDGVGFADLAPATQASHFL